METITIVTHGTSDGDPGPATVNFQIVDGEGAELEKVSESIGNAPLEYAEYYAVVRALQTAKDHFGDRSADLHFKLQLFNVSVKKQLNYEEIVTNPGSVPLFIEFHNLRVANFPNLKIIRTTKKAVKKLLGE